MQRCGKCKQEKAFGEFPPSRRGKGNGHWCRPCASERYKAQPAEKVPHQARACSWCGKLYVPKQLKGPAAFCGRACKEKQRVESGEAREQYLRRKYGITTADYDRLLAEQGGGCAICGKQPTEQKRYSKYLHVDHCHETGRVRGLLCDQHNLLLGRWGDTPDLMERAVAYLRAHA